MMSNIYIICCPPSLCIFSYPNFVYLQILSIRNFVNIWLENHVLLSFTFCRLKYYWGRLRSSTSWWPLRQRKENLQQMVRSRTELDFHRNLWCWTCLVMDISNQPSPSFPTSLPCIIKQKKKGKRKTKNDGKKPKNR